jgi:hypothetical protein
MKSEPTFLNDQPFNNSVNLINPVNPNQKSEYIK